MCTVHLEFTLENYLDFRTRWSWFGCWFTWSSNIRLLLLTFGVTVCLLILFPLGMHPDFEANEGVKWCSGLFLVELISANGHVFSVWYCNFEVKLLKSDDALFLRLFKILSLFAWLTVNDFKELKHWSQTQISCALSTNARKLLTATGKS